MDPAEWRFVILVPEGGQLRVVPLTTGVLFPERVRVSGRYKDGPPVGLSLIVRDGQPVLISLTIGHDDDEEGNPVTPSALHDLPLSQILDQTIGQMTEGMLISRRNAEASETGLPPRFPALGESAAARLAGVASQRGRPVTEEILRRVAEIVKENSYNPRRQIHDEIGASPRTASRWIDEARKRGFLTEED
jgi:hypothetical protein